VKNARLGGRLVTCRIVLKTILHVPHVASALRVKALPEGWRTYFAQQLEQTEK
jgi:hypothetical protein